MGGNILVTQAYVANIAEDRARGMGLIRMAFASTHPRTLRGQGAAELYPRQ